MLSVNGDGDFWNKNKKNVYVNGDLRIFARK